MPCFPNDVGALGSAVGAGELIEGAIEELLGLLAPTESGASDPGRLEREPCLVDVSHLGGVDGRDARAPVGRVLGKAQRLELPDRLTHRRDAHPKTVGDVLEAQRCAGRDLPDHDQLPKRLRRARGHCAPVRRVERGVRGE